jgi:hypothetical protein
MASPFEFNVVRIDPFLNSYSLFVPFQKEICERSCGQKRKHFWQCSPFIYIKGLSISGSVEKMP